MKKINERIEEIIKLSALSNSEFADAIEVPRSSISHILSGRNKPSLDFLMKIKSEFPHYNWDWLIYGTGEMEALPLETLENKKDSKIKATPLPDLFSLIDDDQFELTESEDTILNSKRSEFPVPKNERADNGTAESQGLGTNNIEKANSDLQKNKTEIKRIVFFYNNGSFETFEQ